MLDTLPLIKRLNLDHVDKEGYTSLRCNWMHCPKAQVNPVLGHEDDFWGIQGLYASAWTQFFPKDPVPEAVAGPCCAQFAVSRAAIRRLPIDKYEQMRQWIWTLEVPADQASMKSGLVLEYMWHVIFGKPAYYCPPAKECYCEKWGMCDLQCEREGWCLGRIWHNPLKNPIFGLSKPIPVSAARFVKKAPVSASRANRYVRVGWLARGRTIHDWQRRLLSIPGLGEEPGGDSVPLAISYRIVKNVVSEVESIFISEPSHHDSRM
jgi:hypothetical protein